MNESAEERTDLPRQAGAREGCKECGSTETEMRDYDPRWHEGEIHCAMCGVLVRHFDAG